MNPSKVHSSMRERRHLKTYILMLNLHVHVGETRALYERAVGRYGVALSALDKFIQQEEAPKKSLFEMKAGES